MSGQPSDGQPAAAGGGSPASGALDGVRVLDLSRVLAGPWSTQLLGDLGAEVIKVEKPGTGDDTRAWGPPFLDPAEADGGRVDAAYFTCANRNKLSVALDFTHPDGRAVLEALIPRCQVLVENFKTGGLAKHGLDYDSVRALNPAIVYCSITGFGQDGPYAPRAGYDYLVQAMGGLMSVTGPPDGAPGAEPLKVGVAVADLFTGMYATVAILAALRHAERTGEGQHLDLALLDCQVAMLANQAANFLVSGTAPTRLGNAHPNITPYQVFATRDGHVVVAVGNDGQFASFCGVIGRPDLPREQDFATNAARVAGRARLVGILAPLMAGRTTADWIAALEEAGVPCGPINTIDQVFADPQVQARGLLQPLARPDGSAIPLVANPIRMSATPPSPRRAPPSLGADTDHVLARYAGLEPAAIAALRRDRLVG